MAPRRAVGQRGPIRALELLLGLMLFAACSDSGAGTKQDRDGGSDVASDAGYLDAGSKKDSGPSPGTMPDAGSDADASTVGPGADGGCVEGCAKGWTLLIYLAADNNLESSAISDLEEMMALPESDNLRLLVQIDRAEGYYELGVGGLESFTSTKRLLIRRGYLEELEDLGETNTGDPAALADFIAWGATTFPAEHLGLVLWDHGNAWIGYGGDENTEDHDRLTLEELEQALSSGLGAADRASFDFIGFDACLMSTYETLKVVRPFTRYFIASQEVEPSSGWDYRSFATLIDDPEQSMEQLGARILEGYEALSRAQRRHASITLALHDLDAFDALESALSELTSAVRTNLGGHLSDVGAGRSGAEVFGYHADPARSYDMIDLGDWAQLLARRAAPFVAPAQRVRDALKAMVVSEVKGRNKERASGVSVYFPKLAAHYKPAYDQVRTADAWRQFLTTYYDRAGRLGVRPTFKLGLSKGVSASAPINDPSCGDGWCQIDDGEDPASCAADCATDEPQYETPDCDALPFIPKTLRRPAQTEPLCQGQYMFWCTQEDGHWYRHVRYCPDSQRVCGQAWDDPNDPGNVPSGEGCVIPQGTATLTCQPDGYLELEAELDSGAAQVTAEAFLQYGYYVYFNQQVTLFGRTPAEVDGNWVRGRWDQQVLTLSQAPLQRILFAETRFDDEFAYHEVPLVYSPPSECACILPGDPGYADTDGDGLSDCIDQDMDGDGIVDKDGALESLVRDNCPWIPNPGQQDTNKDGVGDACQDFDGRPVRACDPLAGGQTQYTAFWWIVTDRRTEATVSEALYIDGPSGLSQLAPEAGGRLSPMFLKNGVRGWYWDIGEPLALDFTRPYLFRYGSVERLPLLDASGEPVDTSDGSIITLREYFRLNGHFMELQVSNAAGEGDRIYAFGENSCPPPMPQACPAGQVRDCAGTCQDEARATDLVCDDGTFGSDFNCWAFRYDGGACKPPRCPDGRIRSCNFTCQASVDWIGDGECDTRLNCAEYDWDGGDCGCPQNCFGHGSCVDDVCVCDDGWKGVGCEQPVSCGNAQCEPALGEDCETCPSDCPGCLPQPCGDDVCQENAGDTCLSCPEDCGSCGCGDGQCTPGVEDCTSCPLDCGACPVCGDGICQRWLGPESPFSLAQAESCGVCPSDCGLCSGRCCFSSAQQNAYYVGGGCDVPAVAECVCRLDPTCCLLGWPERCVELAVDECGLVCPEVPALWTCRASYYGDGECDCGCGMWDADCSAQTAKACRYDLCPSGTRFAPEDPTRCIPE